MQPTFRTILPPPDYDFALAYPQPILCLGSCFAEAIGGRLADGKFPTSINPFGIIYHPLALAANLRRLMDDGSYQMEELFQKQEVWRHFDFHSRYAHPDRERCLQQMNESLQKGQAFLQRTDLLLVTLGTAYYFQDKPSGRVVNNCHKLPADRFERRRASVADIVQALGEVLGDLLSRRPELQVIITVSPVRHLRDGLVENQRSKATLVLAVDELCRQLPRLHYFPAYELLLDDLRDYRFYAADMAHPSETAVDYVWEAFRAALFTPETDILYRRLIKLRQSVQHRPLHPASAAHQAFVRRQSAQLEQLLVQYPWLDLTEEIKQISNKM